MFTQKGISFKVFCSLLTLSFLTGTIAPGYAQSSASPLGLISASSAHTPWALKGIKIYPDDPLKFDFLLEEGDVKLSEDELKKESELLIKYFLAALTLPEEDLWVNLSPFEQDKIIPEQTSQTEIGKGLLEQDYLLKRLVSSLTYPETDLGKSFWDKVYQKAYQRFGTSKIPVNTFNKVWIVPDKAVVYEDGQRALIEESKLKVMMEADYVAFKNRGQGSDARRKTQDAELNDLSSQIMKEMVIPAIEEEVNTGENFVTLRKMYRSFILASWFKKRLKESLLGQVYVDQKKTKGIDIAEPELKEKIYQQYLQSYQDGLYNYIKTDYSPQEKKHIKRKYWSGGAGLNSKEVRYRMTHPSLFDTLIPYSGIVGVTAGLDALAENGLPVGEGMSFLRSLVSSPIERDAKQLQIAIDYFFRYAGIVPRRSSDSYSLGLEQSSLESFERKALGEVGGYFWDYTTGKIAIKKASEGISQNVNENIIAVNHEKITIDKTKALLAIFAEISPYLTNICSNRSFKEIIYSVGIPRLVRYITTKERKEVDKDAFIYDFSSILSLADYFSFKDETTSVRQEKAEELRKELGGKVERMIVRYFDVGFSPAQDAGAGEIRNKVGSPIVKIDLDKNTLQGIHNLQVVEAVANNLLSDVKEFSKMKFHEDVVGVKGFLIGFLRGELTLKGIQTLITPDMHNEESDTSTVKLEKVKKILNVFIATQVVLENSEVNKLPNEQMVRFVTGYLQIDLSVSGAIGSMINKTGISEEDAKAALERADYLVLSLRRKEISKQDVETVLENKTLFPAEIYGPKDLNSIKEYLLFHLSPEEFGYSVNRWWFADKAKVLTFRRVIRGAIMYGLPLEASLIQDIVGYLLKIENKFAPHYSYYNNIQSILEREKLTKGQVNILLNDLIPNASSPMAEGEDAKVPTTGLVVLRTGKKVIDSLVENTVAYLSDLYSGNPKLFQILVSKARDDDNKDIVPYIKQMQEVGKKSGHGKRSYRTEEYDPDDPKRPEFLIHFFNPKDGKFYQVGVKEIILVSVEGESENLRLVSPIEGVDLDKLIKKGKEPKYLYIDTRLLPSVMNDPPLVGEGVGVPSEEEVYKIIKLILSKHIFPPSSDLTGPLEGFYDYLKMNYLEKLWWMSDEGWKKQKRGGPLKDSEIKAAYDRRVEELTNLLVKKKIRTEKEAEELAQGIFREFMSELRVWDIMPVVIEMMAEQSGVQFTSDEIRKMKDAIKGEKPIREMAEEIVAISQELDKILVATTLIGAKLASKHFYLNLISINIIKTYLQNEEIQSAEERGLVFDLSPYHREIVNEMMLHTSGVPVARMENILKEGREELKLALASSPAITAKDTVANDRFFKGGIDLNQALLDLKTKGASSPLGYQLDPTKLKAISANLAGFEPKIISIKRNGN